MDWTSVLLLMRKLRFDCWCGFRFSYGGGFSAPSESTLSSRGLEHVNDKVSTKGDQALKGVGSPRQLGGDEVDS